MARPELKVANPMAYEPILGPPMTSPSLMAWIRRTARGCREAPERSATRYGRDNTHLVTSSKGSILVVKKTNIFAVYVNIQKTS